MTSASVATRTSSHDLGKPHPRDDSFKAAARAHQSLFRVRRLGCDRYRVYGSKLCTEDALAGHNFYAEHWDLLSLVRARFPRKDSPLYYDMLRSGHVPFNLFGPLALTLGGSLTRNLVRSLAPDAKEVKAIRVEHAPARGKAALRDNTAFDVLIEYLDAQRRLCALGIEVKYTEGPYPYGKRERQRMFARDSEYHRLTAKSGLFVLDAIERLRTRELKQLWRNHLLGVASGYAQFRSVLLYPTGNFLAAKAARQYQKTLRPEAKQQFLAITYEQWLARAVWLTKEPHELAWLDYLRDRYVPSGRTAADPVPTTPELFVPIKLCVPDGERERYPACSAAARLDWWAMPSVTSMDDMLHLAYAVQDGYLASERLGFGHCGDLANDRLTEFRDTGRYRGTAAELWCCLFFEAPRWAWTDWPGREPDESKPEFDALYRALTAELQAGDASICREGNGVTRWFGHAVVRRPRVRDTARPAEFYEADSRRRV